MILDERALRVIDYLIAEAEVRLQRLDYAAEVRSPS